MSGDYIIMRVDLHEDPAVLRMAGRLKLRPEVVVGYLHRVWSWFSTQTHNGRAGLPSQSVDAALNLPGFCIEMISESWLKIDNEGHVYIPRWDRWNSASAKKRLKERIRRQKYRCDKSVTMSQTECDTRAPTPTPTSTAQPLTGAGASCCWAGWAAADIYQEFSENEKTAVADLATPAHKRLNLVKSSECPVRDAAVLVVHGRLAEGEYWAAVRDAGEAKRDKRKYFAAIVNRMLAERETA